MSRWKRRGMSRGMGRMVWIILGHAPCVNPTPAPFASANGLLVCRSVNADDDLRKTKNELTRK